MTPNDRRIVVHTFKYKQRAPSRTQVMDGEPGCWVVVSYVTLNMTMCCSLTALTLSLNWSLRQVLFPLNSPKSPRCTTGLKGSTTIFVIFRQGIQFKMFAVSQLKYGGPVAI